MTSAGRPSLLDRALDATVALSFDRTGFARHRRHFADPGLRVDLAGKAFAVTGANGGLGLALCRGLAERGATVHLLCRDAGRGGAARDAVAAAGGTAVLHVVDVADPESVRRFVADGRVDALDGLAQNAGALLAERTFAPDGLEQTLATHVVGPLRLLDGLRPALRARGGRVVWVSSGGMYTRRLSVDRLARRDGPFDGVGAYADCKRAQVVLSELLAGELAADGVTTSVMHPGWADTAGVRTALPRFFALTRRILRSPEEGADTALWLLASPEVAGRTGELWFDRASAPTHLRASTREDDAERTRLLLACRAWAARGAGDEPASKGEAATPAAAPRTSPR